MNKLRNKVEQEEPAKAPKQRAVKPLPGAFVSLLNGTFLTRENVLGNMPYILFFFGLLIVYVAYGYSTERVVRDLHRADTELKEMRSEYITVRAQLEKQEQQSHVAAGISDLGLRESRVPPLKIPVAPKELQRTRKP